MLEIERILDNKPIRPPMISTLQMRGLISHGKYAINNFNEIIINSKKRQNYNLLLIYFFMYINQSKNISMYALFYILKVGPPPEIIEN